MPPISAAHANTTTAARRYSVTTDARTRARTELRTITGADNREDTHEPLTIRAAAEILGISVDTIRYYEKEGIAPAPGRSSNGWRLYDQAAMSWLAGVIMLRGTGMNVQEMKEYAAAYRAGANDEERLSLLEQHHAVVLERLAETTRHLRALEHKITAYKTALHGNQG
ncbi:MerR family transcriptional regulator [Arthrobacter agilis]|nr:MerR family transcriptional regulator [Arthrobacter agilis]